MQYDSPITISCYDLIISSTVFIISLFIVFIGLCVAIIWRIFYSIINVPFKIGFSLKSKHANYNTTILLKSLSLLLVNNRYLARNYISKFDKKILKYQDAYNIVLSGTASEVQESIRYLVPLVSSKDYSYFACKQLAKIYHEQGNYNLSEEYGAKAFNACESDIEIMKILICAYGELNIWVKFAFLVSKLQRTNLKKFYAFNSTMILYYNRFTNIAAQKGEKKEAANLNKLALDIDSGNLETIRIYTQVQSSLNKSIDLKLIENAFRKNPSLGIAKIFIEHCKLQYVEIYAHLEKLADKTLDEELSLAIKMYLQDQAYKSKNNDSNDID